MSGEKRTPYGRWLRDVTETWARATGHLTNGVFEMNRAVLAAYGVDDIDGLLDSAPLVDSVDPTASAGPDTTAGLSASTVADLAGDAESEWTVERELAEPGAVTVGDSIRFAKRIDRADVLAFARASGDTNPLHLDDEFAEGTRFEQRIVHGTLVAGLISAALARLPGLTIYVSQTVQFLRPADIGQRLTAVIAVEEDLGDGKYRLSTDVIDGEERPLIEGEAVVLVDTASE